MNTRNLSKLTLLYVEDDTQTAGEFSEFLESIVKTLYVAQNGQQGLELFKKFKPDIVLTDIQMPVMNGLEMSKIIRETDSRVPIFVITAYSDFKYTGKAIDIGLDGYILKPVQFKKFLSKLEIAATHIINYRELEESKKLLEEYKRAVDVSSIVSKTDTRGVITYANDEFCKISGYSRDELIGSSHNIVRHENITAGFYKDLWETIRQKKVWKGKIQNRRKDGSSYFVKSVIVPILDKNDEISEYIALRDDVTELEELNTHLEKRVEEETQKNRKNDKEYIKTLNSILDHSPNPVVIYDGTIVKYANSKFINLTTLQKDEVVNHEFDLETLFEDKAGTITSLKDVELSCPVNKVSISLNLRRNIYNLHIDKIYFKDNKQYTMYTFNNITMLEYQQLKIDSYNAQLSSYIDDKYAKVAEYKSLKIEIEPKNVIDTERIKDIGATHSEKIDCKTFIEQIGSTVIDKIEEFQENVNDAMFILYELENSDTATIFSKIGVIVQDFYEFQRIIDSLATFPVIVKTFNNIANFLTGIKIEQLEDSMKRAMLITILIATLKDLEIWIDTIFIQSSAEDIHFLDETFLSNSLQLEALFNDAVIESDDGLEFF